METYTHTPFLIVNMSTYTHTPSLIVNMNIHIPTAWMKIKIVRTATRTVGENLTKKETFGLWDGHEVEIVVNPTSPSSVLRYAYITGFEVGDEIKVKGELRIKELKLSLIVQQMNYADIGDKESAPEE